MNVRRYTNKLIEILDGEGLDWESVGRECLKYMSEDQVKDMCVSTGLVDENDFKEED